MSIFFGWQRFSFVRIQGMAAITHPGDYRQTPLAIKQRERAWGHVRTLLV